MENTDTLSIKEFARAAGVTVQAVYKRLNNQDDELNNYLVLVENKKRLSKDVLNLIIKPVVKPVEQPSGEVEQPVEQLLNQLNNQLNTLNEQIKLKDELIAAKDEHIADLRKQLDEKEQTLQAVTESLQAAQALHGAAINKNVKTITTAQTGDAATVEDPAGETPKKHGWLWHILHKNADE